MKRERIDPSNLHLPICRSWNDEWFLLTAGDFQAGQYNTMTVAWGGLGCMWSRPMAMVVVRPQRHTRRFIDRFPDFTLSHFPPAYRDALSFCGSHSGKNVDKIKECGLSPIASHEVAAPGFAEADLVLECRTMYHDDFKPERFQAPFIEANYPSHDYHRVYLGEILAVFAAEQFAG